MSELPVDRAGNGPTSNAITRLDQISGSDVRAQSIMAYMLFSIQNTLIKAFEKISKARSESGLSAIQSGFNSADQTKTSGGVLAVGGLALGASGVAQGIGSFKQAQGVARATEERSKALAELERSLKNDPKDLTIQVEALDDPLQEAPEITKQDLTIQIEDLGEPCSGTSNIEDEVLSEVEEEIFYDAEETLSHKQAKPQDQVEEQVKENTQTEQKSDCKESSDQKKNRATVEINKEYGVKVENAKAKASKLQAFSTPGQAAYNIAQGVSNMEKSKADRETLLQQVQQDNQNQQGNTAEDIKRKADKLAEFNPSDRNSSSFRG